MDAEKSSGSSFEDLSNINDKPDSDSDDVIDIIGNGQLIKRTLVKSTSEYLPQRGDVCKINFVGKLENGTIVEEENNFVVQVGDVEVAQGIDMAIPLMRIGEKAEITSDARFAYGSLGLKNEECPEKSVPPGAKIIYTVDLLEAAEEEDLDTKTFEQRKAIGDRKRERGNFWYSRNEYSLAIQTYRRALEYLDDSEHGISGATDSIELTNAQLQELLDIRVKVYNNLAASQMKISAYDAALQSVDNVLRCQPENLKALFRKGKILEAKGDNNAAIPILQKAAIIDADSTAIQQLLSKCVLKSRRDARNEKDMYQKMLGQVNKMTTKPKTGTVAPNRDVPKLKLWGYFMGSILIGVAGVAIYRYKYF